jgi:hypothetical protein
MRRKFYCKGTASRATRKLLIWSHRDKGATLKLAYTRLFDLSPCSLLSHPSTHHTSSPPNQLSPPLDTTRSTANQIRYMLFFPLLLIFTPSPSKSIQSILYALSAPIRPGPISASGSSTTSNPVQPIQPGETSKPEKVKEEEEKDPRRKGVGGGDTIRDCSVIEYVLFCFLLHLFQILSLLCQVS